MREEGLLLPSAASYGSARPDERQRVGQESSAVAAALLPASRITAARVRAAAAEMLRRPRRLDLRLRLGLRLRARCLLLSHAESVALSAPGFVWISALVEGRRAEPSEAWYSYPKDDPATAHMGDRHWTNRSSHRWRRRCRPLLRARLQPVPSTFPTSPSQQSTKTATGEDRSRRS